MPENPSVEDILNQHATWIAAFQKIIHHLKQEQIKMAADQLAIEDLCITLAEKAFGQTREQATSMIQEAKKLKHDKILTSLESLDPHSAAFLDGRDDSDFPETM